MICLQWQNIGRTAAIAAVLFVRSAAMQFFCIPAQSAEDPLPSWNEGTAKQQIRNFVQLEAHLFLVRLPAFQRKLHNAQ